MQFRQLLAEKWPKMPYFGRFSQLLEHGLGPIRVEKIQNRTKSVFGPLNGHMIWYKANRVGYSGDRAVTVPEIV